MTTFVGNKGVFSKTDKRWFWGSHGDADLATDWKYYLEPDSYQRVLRAKQHWDPIGVFSPNRFCIGYTAAATAKATSTVTATETETTTTAPVTATAAGGAPAFNVGTHDRLMANVIRDLGFLGLTRDEHHRRQPTLATAVRSP